MILKNITSLFLFVVFVSLLYFLVGNFQTAFSTQIANASTPLRDQPTSIEDIDCGGYVVGVRFRMDDSGRDFLQFYPETDRQFDVPLLGMKGEDSFKFENTTVFFEVDYPLDKDGKGAKQGFFHFKKFVRTATLPQIYKQPIRKIHEHCL